MALDLFEVGLLRWVARGHFGEDRKITVHCGHGVFVGLKITVLAREKVTALSRFSVLHGRQDLVYGHQCRMGSNHLLTIGAQALDVEVGDDAANQEEGENEHDAHSDPNFDLRSNASNAMLRLSQARSPTRKVHSALP